MDKQTKEYFEKLKQCSVSDVKRLLEAKLECAGPLLMVVMNGIDAFGGICYGFKSGGGKERFTKFMEKHMSIPKSLAEFSYKVVRNGIVHEGMPKKGLIYGVWYNLPGKDRIFYKDLDKKKIWMNVVEFASSYLNAVENLSSEDIRCYPKTFTDSQQPIIDRAIKDVSSDVRLIKNWLGRPGTHMEINTSTNSRML